MPPGDAHSALAGLRAARRRRRIASFDIGEAVYRVYITAVVSGIVVWVASGAVGDGRLHGAAAATVARRGPQVVGALIGAMLAIGARSGSRGGPLVIEAADVRHVLMSPVDRTAALRAPALRQLRFGAAAGAGAGAVAGLLAYRRLPGTPVGWILGGAVTGALAVLAALGMAMVVSGRRVGKVPAAALALALVGWSAADLSWHLSTSPATWLGALAIWPLHVRLVALAGAALAVAVMVVGYAGVGGVSIEAAERRASLVGQIRFAATLRDLRTVVVLRRQLTQEQSRQRPWVRLPRALPFPLATGGRRRRRLLPVWRRSWHGITRFPGGRVARMVVLAGVAGAAAVGAYRGTTPLLLVTGGALYVAALDAVEPLAQELDHPDRLDGFPVVRGLQLLHLAAAPAAVAVVLSAFGSGVAWAVAGGGTTAIEVGAVVVVPAALAALAGAAASVVQGAPSGSSFDAFLPPEAAGARAVLRMALPPVIAVAGTIPVLTARHPAHGLTPVEGAAQAVAPVLLVVMAVAGWIRYRDAVRDWFSTVQEEAAKAGRRPAPGASGAE